MIATRSGLIFFLLAMLQVVLSCTQDEFFAQNRFSNFGDLGVAVKGLMDDYQKATRLNENINSIEDMQAFLERQVVEIDVHWMVIVGCFSLWGVVLGCCPKKKAGAALNACKIHKSAFRYSIYSCTHFLLEDPALW